MKKKSIIVVSDTHFGREISNYKAFESFSDWLLSLEKEPKTVKLKDGREKVISKPDLLILLGDILELWDPVDDDPVYILKHALKPLEKTMQLGCNKVYVAGNHDEDIGYFAGKYRLSNATELEIIPRHYPESPEQSIEVGASRLFFLHGHQFDKTFRFFGNLASMPSVMAKLSFLTVTGPLKGWLFPLLFAIFLVLYRVVQIPLARYLLLILTTVAGVFAIPKLFTLFQTYVWKPLSKFAVKKPKYKDIKTIIEEEYYKREKDTIQAKVVVFGHTHVPDMHEEFGKVFVNSGGWVKEEGVPCNTFVYIDEEGVFVFRWDEEKKEPEHLSFVQGNTFPVVAQT